MSDQHASTWTNVEVFNWIHLLQLSEYAEPFWYAGVDGKRLVSLNEQEVKKICQSATSLGREDRAAQLWKNIKIIKKGKKVKQGKIPGRKSIAAAKAAIEQEEEGGLSDEWSSEEEEEQPQKPTRSGPAGRGHISPDNMNEVDDEFYLEPGKDDSQEVYEVPAPEEDEESLGDQDAEEEVYDIPPDEEGGPPPSTPPRPARSPMGNSSFPSPFGKKPATAVLASMPTHKISTAKPQLSSRSPAIAPALPTRSPRHTAPLADDSDEEYVMPNGSGSGTFINEEDCDDEYIDPDPQENHRSIQSRALPPKPPQHRSFSNIRPPAPLPGLNMAAPSLPPKPEQTRTSSPSILPRPGIGRTNYPKVLPGPNFLKPVEPKEKRISPQTSPTHLPGRGSLSDKTGGTVSSMKNMFSQPEKSTPEPPSRSKPETKNKKPLANGSFPFKPTPPIPSGGALHNSNLIQKQEPQRPSRTAPDQSLKKPQLKPFQANIQAPSRPPPDDWRSVPKSLDSFDWYHGNLLRENADAVLKNDKREGAFIVRKNNKDPKHPYSLSLYYKKKVFNLRIRLKDNKTFALGTEKEGEQSFDSVEGLIEYHRNNELILANNAGRTILRHCAQP